MSLLTVGVLKSPTGEADRRLPIHPDHFAGIEADLRKHVLLEKGYGKDFGVADRELDPLIGGFMNRERLIEQADALLVVDPTSDELNHLRPGQVVCGWVGADGAGIVKLARERGLTLIDGNAMNHWATDGSFVAPVFHTNNELAGYASVLHAMALRGLTGQFGLHLTAVVLGLGNVAKGAIRALEGIGIKDITVLTLANGSTRPSQLGGMTMEQMQRRDDDPSRTLVFEDGGSVCVGEFVGRYDVVVNCIAHYPQNPLLFVDEEQIGYFPAGRLIVDVCPKAGVGFEFARPTPAGDPTFEVGNGVTYYAGNGSQAYLWNSATWEISRELLPYLRSVMRGPEGWDSDRTLSRALSVRDGQVKTQGGQT